MGNACIKCLFWHDEDGNRRRGKCHRYPPVPEMQGGGSYSYSIWAHPATSARDWCGEFRPTPEDRP